MSKTKPTFQANQTFSSFNQRHVGEKQTDKSKVKKGEKSPHFHAQKSRHKPQDTQRISEPYARSVELVQSRGQGKVNVVFKGNADVEKQKVKKTGALSPRAPEKIKKNRAEEMKVYGENACLALFAQRPESIVRVWATVEMSHKIGDMFSYLAKNKKVYHVVDAKELALVSGTDHHGGICMLVKKLRTFTLDGYLDIPRQRDCLVLLDDVRNAHNLGGVIRTCAFYGVKGVIIDDSELLNSASAMRVAEGGMEYIRPLHSQSSESALEKLRHAGYQVIHISTQKHFPALTKVQLADKVVFVLGEQPTDNFAQPQDVCVNLSVANPLSADLNIAVKAGVLLAYQQAQN